MMRPIRILAPIFIKDDIKTAKFSLKAIVDLMEGLCRYNLSWIKYKRGNVPRLYASGIRYRPERGKEDWLAIPVLLYTREGDCEDLSCYRIAELRYRGVDARPNVIARKVRKGQWKAHARVLLPDGKIEDPSKIAKRIEAAR